MLVQQRFLGASIANFNGSMGWGQTPSSLNVTLVEDKDNGDWFSPPPPGTPVEFNYIGWIFRGLLQSWKKSRSQSGELYNVVLIDPREILDGVQIITGSHTGITGTSALPNLINVYDYLESTGFGDSERNSAGIPWKKVKNAITLLTQNSSLYGGQIHLRGHRYNIDIDTLPGLDESYRVGASNQMTLMGFITEICEAANHDFFIDLDSTSTIKVHTISRVNQPTPGALTTYINSIAPTIGITSSEVGAEFRNDTCNKYLLGASKREFTFRQTSLNSSGEPVNKDLWPFWGFDAQDQVIIGDGINDSHTFTLDSRSLNNQTIGDTYKTDVAEIRAAAQGFDDWAAWLQFKDKDQNSPQFNRYTKLGLIGTVNVNNASLNSPINMNLLDKKSINKLKDSFESDIHETQQKIYNFVKQFADNYYGRKFMINLPNLKLYKNPDEYNYNLNYEPIDGAFLDPVQWSGAVNSNMMPPETLRLMNEDGTFPCYVRYDAADLLDFSEMPDDAMLWKADKKSVFIKAEVNSKVGFEYVRYNGQNTPDYSGARGFITLPGIVRFKIGQKALVESGVFSNVNAPLYTDFGAIVKSLNKIAIASGMPAHLSGVMLNSFGIDTVFAGKIGASLMPNMVAVPLKDNTKRYGPWYASGADGKMDFEIDENLAPWNYGGYDRMNLIGNAKVVDGISQMQQSETGSIEVPGIPTFSMGQQIPNGPYITDIDVTVGQQGVTSVYRFSTWNPQFGQLRKSYIDRINKLSQQTNDLRNIAKGKAENLRARGLSNVEKEIYTKERIKDIKRLKGFTSHGVVSGEGIYVDASSVVPNAWVQPIYNFSTQLNEYDRKAGVSIDGLFRPFTTNVRATGIGLPQFVTPSSGAERPTVNDLNPYFGRHDINMVVRGSALPEDLSILRDSGYHTETDYRSMALRGPVIIAGWGYDIDDRPVPNESGWKFNSGQLTDSFYPQYRTRQDLWPVGPLDARWDESRGVWVAGGTALKVVRITSKSGESFPTDFSRVYYAEEMGVDFSPAVNNLVKCSGTGKFLYVGNFRQNVVLESSIYTAAKIGGKYYLDNQSVFNFIG